VAGPTAGYPPLTDRHAGQTDTRDHHTQFAEEDVVDRAPEQRAEDRDDRDNHDPVELRTWEDAEARTREFEALLQKYDGDFQKATDAQLRGERADPGEVKGSRNPM